MSEYFEPKNLGTVHSKTSSGWESKTRVSLPAKRQLNITTSKSMSGTLVTRATVHTLNGDGSMTFRMGFGTGGDFSRTLCQSATRVTSNAVQSQHDKVLQDLSCVVSQALEHYRQQETAESEVVHA